MNRHLINDLRWLAEQDPPPGAFPSPAPRGPGSDKETKPKKEPKSPEQKAQAGILKVIDEVQKWAVGAQKDALTVAAHLVKTYPNLDSTQLRACRRLVDKLTEASKAIDEVSQEAQDSARHIQQPI